MKKIIFIFFIISIIITGCSTSTSSNQTETPILTGKITRNMIENDQYSWFKTGYDAYNPDAAVIENIKKYLNEYNTLIYMGTWCGDSKRDVPKFYKIADLCNYSKIEITGLDKKKKSPEGTESNYKIEKVPTFIFLKDNKETGRIVEMPEKTLEEDMLKIIQPK
jgi:thiol-disulfide isomerase/thioredoxin